MKLTIRDKPKKDTFIALFHLLKNVSTIIHMTFEPTRIHIQGMDTSHVCLYDAVLMKEWFQEYEAETTATIAFNVAIFHQIISHKSENCAIVVSTQEESLLLDLLPLETSSGEYIKHFKLPLCDNYEYEEMLIPPCEYDAEFSMSTKQIFDIISQMVTFGTNLCVKCSEEKIELAASGSNGEMVVDICTEDLTEYSIVEDQTIELTFAMSFVHKMLSNKLSNEIEFFVSLENPLKIKYCLDQDANTDSVLLFYIAPKLSTE